MYGQYQPHDEGGGAYQWQGFIADQITLSQELRQLKWWPQAFRENPSGKTGKSPGLLQEYRCLLRYFQGSFFPMKLWRKSITKYDGSYLKLLIFIIFPYAAERDVSALFNFESCLDL